MEELNHLKNQETGLLDYFRRGGDTGKSGQQKQQTFIQAKPSQEEVDDEIQLLITEEGIMKQAGVDYKSKFKEINWTVDINKELPIRFSADK